METVMYEGAGGPYRGLVSAADPAWTLEAVATRTEQEARQAHESARSEWAELFGTDQADIYARLGDAVRAARKSTTRKNTTRARRDAEAAWKRFCAALGVPTGVVVGDVLSGYAMWLLSAGSVNGGPLAYNTGRTHLKNTFAILRDAGVTLPENAARDASAMLTLAHEELKRDGAHRKGRGQAEAITWDDLCKAVDACDPDRLSGLRDRALLLTGWLLMSRASELAGLCWADVEWLRAGKYVAVTVRASKTSGSARTNHAEREDGPHCVVSALHAYQEALTAQCGPQPVKAPLFRRIWASGKVGTEPLSPATVTRLITSACEAAKLNYHVTGHSLRAGGATDALAAGHPLIEVARIGGWTENSTELAGYLRDSRDLAQKASVRRMRRSAKKETTS